MKNKDAESIARLIGELEENRADAYVQAALEVSNMKLAKVYLEQYRLFGYYACELRKLYNNA